MNFQNLDHLGHELGQAALRILVRLCPKARTAPEDRLEAACEAMRAAVKDAVEELLADAKAAPWLAQVAFTSAVLTIAQAGIAVLREPAQTPMRPAVELAVER